MAQFDAKKNNISLADRPEIKKGGDGHPVGLGTESFLL